MKHALSVAASMKEKKTDRSMGEETDRCDGQIQPLDSPHPAVIDSERLASPHPAHAQLQKDLEQQLHLHNPLQKLMSTNLNASSASGGAKDSTSTSSKTSTPRRSMTPRQPMMTIVEDKELSTDHRSQVSSLRHISSIAPSPRCATRATHTSPRAAHYLTWGCIVHSGVCSHANQEPLAPPPRLAQFRFPCLPSCGPHPHLPPHPRSPGV